MITLFIEPAKVRILKRLVFVEYGLHFVTTKSIMHNVSVMKLIHLEIEFISQLVCLNQHHSYQVLRGLYHINLILVFLFLFFWVMLTLSYHWKRGNQWLVEVRKSK